MMHVKLMCVFSVTRDSEYGIKNSVGAMQSPKADHQGKLHRLPTRAIA